MARHIGRVSEWILTKVAISDGTWLVVCPIEWPLHGRYAPLIFFRWNSTFFVWYTMHAVFLDGCWPNLPWLMEGWTCWWCTLFNDIIKLVMGHWFPLKDVLFCMPFVFQATFPVISLPNLVKVITTSQGWMGLIQWHHKDVIMLVTAYWFRLKIVHSTFLHTIRLPGHISAPIVTKLSMSDDH